MRGLSSSATETPEIVLARENAKRISDVRKHHVSSNTDEMFTSFTEQDEDGVWSVF